MKLRQVDPEVELVLCIIYKQKNALLASISWEGEGEAMTNGEVRRGCGGYGCLKVCWLLGPHDVQLSGLSAWTLTCCAGSTR